MGKADNLCVLTCQLNNEALPGLVMGGAGGVGDGHGGEHHRLPEGPSGPQSGEQLLPFEEDKDMAVNAQRW